MSAQALCGGEFAADEPTPGAILRLHDTKRSLADALLEGADMSSRLSKEELLKLLSDQG